MEVPAENLGMTSTTFYFGLLRVIKVKAIATQASYLSAVPLMRMPPLVAVPHLQLIHLPLQDFDLRCLCKVFLSTLLYILGGVELRLVEAVFLECSNVLLQQGHGQRKCGYVLRPKSEVFASKTMLVDYEVS